MSEQVPEICTRCGNWKPMFYRVQNKDCAAFGNVKGVKNNRCGAWCKRIEHGKTDELENGKRA